MSGQPNRKPNDASRFREDYMKALNLRADVDKMNLQANNVYKQTGQLPPMSQMPDNRTTTEILGDVAKLKTELIKDLAPIASPQLAQMIINRIEQSPLNVDGGLFTFFVQRAPEMVALMKKSYKYGIKGDINDAMTFVSQLENYYKTSRSMLGGYKEFINRPSSAISSDKMNFTKIADAYQNLVPLLMSKTTIYGKVIESISQRLISLASILKSGEIIENLRAKMNLALTSPSGFDDFARNIKIRNDMTELFQILDDLPNEDTILTLLYRLDKNTDGDTIDRIIKKINELVPSIQEIDRIFNLLTSIHKVEPINTKWTEEKANVELKEMERKEKMNKEYRDIQDIKRRINSSNRERVRAKRDVLSSDDIDEYLNTID